MTLVQQKAECFVLMQLVSTGVCNRAGFLPIYCCKCTVASGDTGLALMSWRGEMVFRMSVLLDMASSVAGANICGFRLIKWTATITGMDPVVFRVFAKQNVQHRLVFCLVR